jgi:NAD(P)-dependent dehydrogenase (short-subunit alcohol dehydrogenase family)
MSEISPKIYLVAGATRGLGIFTKCRHLLRTDILVFIGLALVDDIATKDPSAVIYAGARDPTNGAAQLIQVAAKYPGRVQVVRYVAGDKEGNDALAKQIAAEHGRLDTVIANAGAFPISPCPVIRLIPAHFVHSHLRYHGKKGSRNAC